MEILQHPERFPAVCEWYGHIRAHEYCRTICPGRLVEGKCWINPRGRVIENAPDRIKIKFKHVHAFSLEAGNLL